MIFREAKTTDIPQIQIVRHTVKENVLSNPALVTDKDCEDYLIIRGKGWVCEIEQEIVGFAIADLIANNVWALFLNPEHEGKGIGKKLHDTMLNWYFSQTKETLWLGTEFNTRAEKFYRLQGWTEAGLNGSDEIRFEMSYDAWRQQKMDKV
ncbi:GNAT superfamily N-acetyltransferase [Pontibacter aydingkolensis]|uniref:GNAT family N-acetyltransferase n=1 Tax=Pontibacter aydingkolensis TaxID=1911536 RepID=A0ABS7CZX2_9BACT|nr:GNAT family N-acetyltransferase [Pontibacter aydingkolensis]MBW7469363.1 GNAT family N-acetyltransferase [Pontibacter aydingkolensis]